MAGHEITTRLPGGRGEPMLVIREPGWQQQAAAEQEAQRRDEIKAEVERIEREAFIRKTTPPVPLVSPDPVARVHAEWESQKWLDECAELRDVPRRQAELESWARKVELERAMAPPGPPQPMRYGKALSPAEVAYERDQAEWQARQARPAGGGCGYCSNCRLPGGGQFCLYG